MITLLSGTAGEVPADDGWLAGGEPAVLAGLRLAPRRESWRMGRWVAKDAVGMVLGLAPEEVEIRAAADGAPEAFRAGGPCPATISISHRSGVAVCAVATPPAPVGCDLELVEPRAGAFVAEWFTAVERGLLATVPAEDRDLVITLQWSAKECALKVARSGLRGDPRAIEVTMLDGETAGWQPLAVRDRNRGVALDVWWVRRGDLVLTVAGAVLPAPPALVQGTADRRHRTGQESPSLG
jgi:4'-phosphopantetheinyl transferase